MQRLRQRGSPSVYISHFLEEVRQIADRFTVLRDGRSVGSGDVGAFSTEPCFELMVGRSLAEQFPHVRLMLVGEPILELTPDVVAGASSEQRVNLTLHPRRGRLGLAGIVGARADGAVARTIFGLDPVPERPSVVVKTVAGPAHSRAGLRSSRASACSAKIARRRGWRLERSVIADNLTYSRLRPYSWCGWLDLRRRRRAVVEWLAKLRVRSAGPEQAVGELSGGNQQKVALGRLLHQEADVLLLDEPTRGVDVGSKAEIYRLIGELAAQGRAVLFVSSYLPELLGVCDRLAVMARGRLSAVRPTREWSPEQVMAFATGV